MLDGKKILIAITGSIAAYKIPLLVREFIKAGAEVKVLMTPSAKDFVSPLTLSTLSKNPVLWQLFDEQEWANHVILGRWADVMLIAPLSCNTLSKMAHGQCDNLVLATYLSATCPVIVAPAMDEDMWHHPTTTHNLEVIQKNGCSVIPVGHGELASGLTGDGRMAEIDIILKNIEEFFSKSSQLHKKKVLVTAGPTYEAIDPVRFIGNHSSGKMGFAIAEEFSKRGANVTLVSGPVHIKPKEKLNLIAVQTAAEMYEACNQNLDYDIAVMAAAVADYKAENTAAEKIKKKDQSFSLQLTRTQDILAELGRKKTNGQILVGFALETNNERGYALQKLKEKNADLIILNSLKDKAAGFGFDTNKINIFYKNGKELSFDTKTKSEVAKDIIDSIIELL